jgi:hypothetical protein
MPISKRTPSAEANPQGNPTLAATELSARMTAPKTYGPMSLTPPGSPASSSEGSATDLALHQDPEVGLALKLIDELKTEEIKAMIALQEAETTRSMWSEIEQNNREIFRASKQLHYDAHKSHISTEFEAAEDQELEIKRRQATEQGILAQTDCEQAKAQLKEIRDQLQTAKRQYEALLKYRLTGQAQEDIDEQLNPFARFGPWGQKYGWYLLAFIVFAALVLLYIH